MLILSLLSLILMFADYRFRQMDVVRYVLSTLVAPIQIVVDVPSQVWTWADRMTEDYETLHKENQELKAQALILQRKVQKMAGMTTENIRLRELLGGTERLDEKVMVAEVIGVDPDPFIHELVINKGITDKVEAGMPLLDANGVMGQVTSVSRYTSRVLLITDARHAIPVVVNRNGVRAIASGGGKLESLELMHIPATADVQEGDILLTSGLGGRFPFGYPVATVTSVQHDPGQRFTEVKVTPTAQLARSRQVMLVVSLDTVNPPTDSSIMADKGES